MFLQNNIFMVYVTKIILNCYYLKLILNNGVPRVFILLQRYRLHCYCSDYTYHMTIFSSFYYI